MKLKYIVLLFSIPLFSQNKLDVKYYYEEVKDGFEIMVDNNEFCDVSVVLQLNHKNVTVSSKRQNTFLIPARQKKVKLSELMAIDYGVYGFDFTHREFRGDIAKVRYNKSFPYSLPFSRGQSFLVTQGYDGELSHKGKKALDFKMPVGTPVKVMRGGTVVKVEDSFNEHGETADYSRYSNHVIVMHPDGTFARYASLKQNSAKVKAGDLVTTGTILALSGNTGWTKEPHLHIEIYIPRPLTYQYIETKFKVGSGHVFVFLEEGKKAIRKY